MGKSGNKGPTSMRSAPDPFPRRRLDSQNRKHSSRVNNSLDCKQDLFAVLARHHFLMQLPLDRNPYIWFCFGVDSTFIQKLAKSRGYDCRIKGEHIIGAGQERVVWIFKVSLDCLV